ncbi:MAG: exosome complex RNA-binding protein Rrp4 [Candidatus Methanomethylicia archaeon]|nr:exosome complex RNA-binding protein Rrp4 [Candidatus Methanomethylicia archaeon]MCX8169039.1 exosome complex RNA-binding protein Rrp4 [Candidatus Methanomethylicia archaeon]MDW7988771.1 exosome complex RNA-binding protein Rrp4 [Nitrososphaerota archaeon]
MNDDKTRTFIFPGDIISEGHFKPSVYTYYEGNQVFSSVFGLCEFKNKKAVNVIPLQGFYIPRVGDTVIGIVIDNSPTSWHVDINSPYIAILQVSDAVSKPVDVAREDIRRFLKTGDILMAEIIAFDKLRSPLLSIKGKNLGKLENGTLITLSPVKIPRLIGKRGSMINMIKKELNYKIVMGRNGRIWVSSTDPQIVNLVKTIVSFVEEKSHLPGLTNKVKELIAKEIEKIKR